MTTSVVWPFWKNYSGVTVCMCRFLFPFMHTTTRAGHWFSIFIDKAVQNKWWKELCIICIWDLPVINSSICVVLTFRKERLSSYLLNHSCLARKFEISGINTHNMGFDAGYILNIDWCLLGFLVGWSRKGRPHLVRSQSLSGPILGVWSLCLKWSEASLEFTTAKPSVKLRSSPRWLVIINFIQACYAWKTWYWCNTLN